MGHSFDMDTRVCTRCGMQFRTWFLEPGGHPCVPVEAPKPADAPLAEAIRRHDPWAVPGRPPSGG